MVSEGVMLDVIILSRNAPEKFRAAVESLDAQGVEYRGILVQNGSDRESEEIALDHGWMWRTPIGPSGPYNSSFAEGNNLAVRLDSRPEADLLLMNNDVVLHQGALAAMLEHDQPLVAPMLVYPDGLVNFAGGSFPGGWPKHVGRRSDPREWKGRCRHTDWVTFACVLIRRDVWQRVGGLDEVYETWTGYEDVEFCLQARARGVRSFICTDAVATHDESFSKSPELRRDTTNARIWKERHALGGV